MFRKMGWRLFPIGLSASMALVFLINGYMVYAAVRSFPGDAGMDGFDLSNHYDAVLGTASRQAALGWTIEAVVDTANRPQLHLSGPSGAPLPAATIEAKAERPVGPEEATTLVFHQAAATRYVTDAPLDRGQWDVLLTVSANGQTVTTTRRLMVP